MYRGSLRTGRGEALGIGLGDQPCVETAEAVSDFSRPREGNLHGNLLVKQHPNQQRERIFRQQGVGDGILCQLQSRHDASLGINRRGEVGVSAPQEGPRPHNETSVGEQEL